MFSLSVADVVKLLVSAVLGGVVGFEREVRQKPAGLRTNILVSVAATLFTILSVNPAFGDPNPVSHDPARIAANILTGVGFLGAGVIFSSGGYVKGITTAASLWMTTALGMAVGIGEYLLALVATLIVLIDLTVLYFLEKVIENRRLRA